MSTEIINSCDKCKEFIHEKDQIWDVGVVTNCRQDGSRGESNLNLTNRYMSSQYKIEICRSCMKSIGILPYEKSEPEAEKTPPTLEERIEEIVQIYLEDNHS